MGNYLPHDHSFPNNKNPPGATLLTLNQSWLQSRTAFKLNPEIRDAHNPNNYSSMFAVLKGDVMSKAISLSQRDHRHCAAGGRTPVSIAKVTGRSCAYQGTLPSSRLLRFFFL
ncbi:hypothetical protein GMOD_00002536 [Pyrenophora seminiperda CCB06]|uniref:Uncharacterized protein n=1 Tax=Pyrenophora seminiperda CCB06 TaxID=1302712 RepID=A0A3M7M2L8_9PLEO|nr:hypothetical protein GMOD_00002536 [Pyrenophora seminiperda CCB06]